MRERPDDSAGKVRRTVYACSRMRDSGLLFARVGEDYYAIYKELVANIVPGSRMVSAGVVAVTRAQEYGYALIYSV